MNKTFKILLSFLLLTLTYNVNASSQKLTIGLDWFINPDHAPLIIAKKRNTPIQKPLFLIVILLYVYYDNLF